MGEDIAQVSNFQVSRWIGAVGGQEYNLHLFTDASESAYACCLYICLKASAQLIYSKGKVAPLRTISLARLELQAAFLGAKCADFICQELRIKVLEVHAWTESITVWHWLQKPAYSWTTWVANRVSVIEDISNRLNMTWRHCPGSINPGDLPSRGGKMSSMEQWRLEPRWITEKGKWPKPCVAGPDDEVLNTVRVSVVSVNAALIEYPWWTRILIWTRLVGLGAQILSWKMKDISQSWKRGRSVYCIGLFKKVCSV